MHSVHITAAGNRPVVRATPPLPIQGVDIRPPHLKLLRRMNQRHNIRGIIQTRRRSRVKLRQLRRHHRFIRQVRLVGRISRQNRVVHPNITRHFRLLGVPTLRRTINKIRPSNRNFRQHMVINHRRALFAKAQILRFISFMRVMRTLRITINERLHGSIYLGQ